MRPIPNEGIKKEWLDFTTLSKFLLCPRAYWWNRIKGICRKPGPQLTNGRAYHKAIEVYEIAKMGGMSMESAIEKGVEVGREIMQTIPTEQQTSHFTVDVFIPTFTNYCKLYEHEPYTTTSIEDGMSVDLGEFVYVCLVDRWAISPLGKVAIEHKTTSIPTKTRWSHKSTPNLQVDGYVFTNYLLTGKMPYGAILDVIPMHSDAKKREQPFRLSCIRTAAQAEHWIADITSWFHAIKVCEEHNHFPRNTNSCTSLIGWQRDHRIIGWQCEYHTLCNLYPMQADGIHIPDDFEMHNWTPYQGL